MIIKKITAFAVSFVMSVGVLAAVPGEVGLPGNAAITVSAAENSDSDFVIKTDSEGKKYIESYTGKGGNIRIPDGVAYTGEEAFLYNGNITGITFPASCTEIKVCSFFWCRKLKTVVFEGDVKLEQGAFACCYALKKVSIKGSIKEHIGDDAFYGCCTLKSVIISGNKNSFDIGETAFGSCEELVYVKIPGKCKKIGEGAFKNCFNLDSLTIPAKTEMGSKSAGYAVLTRDDPAVVGYIDHETFVADGKRSGYAYDYVHNKDFKVTPVRLTLTVTKGSPAEKYAKENGIKYKYAK